MDNQSRQKIDGGETNEKPLLAGDTVSSANNVLRMTDLGSVQTPFSPTRFLIITIGGIFLAEVIAMIVIYGFPHLPYYQQVLLDAGIMVVLIFPILYYFSLKPLLLYIEKLQRLGNALRQSEERFALAYRSNPAALSITRVEDGSFIEVNDSFLRLFGYTRNEVLGHTPDELNLYPDPDELEKLKWLLLKNRSVDNFELTTRVKSGEIRTLSVSTEAIELDNEVYILAIASDITERNQAQEQVREMALFPTLNPDPVLQVYPSGRIKKANPAAVQIGLCEGAQLTEILPDLLELDLPACIAAGVTQQIQMETSLGELVLLWKVRGVPDLGLAFLYGEDITQRKQVEAAIRQLSSIVEQTEDTVVVTDRKGVIEYVNPAFERLTGFTKDEALGKTPNILKSDLQDGQFYKTLWNTILNGNVFLGEITNRKKNGDLFHEVKTITPLRDVQGNITHFVATGKDITDHKLDEEKLRKAYDELELRVQERTIELRLANSELAEEIRIRQHVEVVLRQNEQQLSRAQEIAHLGSWELDLENDRLTWSDEVYRIFGLQPQEFDATYEAFLEAIHPDDRAMVNATYSNSIAEGRNHYEIEHRIVRRPNGEVRIVHEKCEHFKNEAGQIIRSVGMVHDITERKHAEEVLRRNESLLRQTGEMAKVGGWELDLQIMKLVWTLETYNIHEVDPSLQPELEGALNFYAPEARPQIAEAVRRAIEEGQSYDMELPLITAKGRSIWVRTIGQAEFRDGECVRLFGAFQDITERKRAEEHVTYQARLLSSVNDAIVGSDPQFRLNAWNASAESMYGWKAEEVLGRNGVELLRTEWPQEDADVMRRTIAETGRWRGEATQLCKDGTRIPVEVSSIVLRNVDGQITGYVSVNRDITERKLAEEALRKAHDELELRVQERTKELAAVNTALVKEIVERSEVERQLRIQTTAMEAAANGILITDPQGIIQWTNPALTQITGYEAGELLGQNTRIFNSGKQDAAYYAQMWNTIFAGQIWRGETTNRRKDRSLYVEEQTITPVRDENGQIQHFIAIKQDITERKQSELELAKRNIELQALSIAEREQRQLSDALVAAALVLNKHMKLDEILPLILEKIKEVIPYQLANIAMLDGESFYDASHQGDSRWPNALVGMKNRFPLEDFHLLTKMCQTGQPLLIMDIQKEPEWVSANGLEWCRSFLSAPLLEENQVIGFVNLFAEQPGFFTTEMQDRLVAFASHAAVAIQNAWLFEQVRASNDRLQSLSHRLVEIQENERLYISRELHDEAGQMLTSLILDLRTLETQAHQPEAILKKVAEMEVSLNAVSESLHSVAMALRPASLDHLGLVPALRQQVESIGEKNGLKASFRSGKFHERLPANMETELYRIVQEALTNVVRHAHASRVDVILTVRDNKLIVIVEDDGDGFNPQLVPNSGHLGLFGIRERVDMIGGKLLIESAPGKGTTLIVEVTYADSIIDRG